MKGKRVLVTGAGGFMGSHLVWRLLKEGSPVRALVRYNAQSSWGWLEEIPECDRAHLEVVFGDVRDAEQMAALAGGVEVIFHLAALISIPYSYEAPRSFVETNVQGTLNVLMAARRQGGGIRVIHTSTSEVYGTPETVPIRESHPLQGQSPYSASKIGADKLAESFYYAYNLPVTILRPFNTYGPRQSSRAVLPAILTQLLSGCSELRLGALWPRRDLTYVEDTVDGFFKAALSDRAIGRTVQLGTGRDVSVEELANIAMDAVGKRVKIVCEDKRLRPPQSEVKQLLSAPSLAKELLGWQPKTSLEQGIRDTVAWLGSRLNRYKTGQYLV